MAQILDKTRIGDALKTGIIAIELQEMDSRMPYAVIVRWPDGETTCDRYDTLREAQEQFDLSVKRLRICWQIKYQS